MCVEGDDALNRKIYIIYTYVQYTDLEMRMMAHRWMFNTRRDRYDTGLECAGVNKRRVNRQRMENGILKYASARALCRRT